MAVESRERWPTSRSRWVFQISASCTRWGNCVSENSAKAPRRPTRSAPHSFAPSRRSAAAPRRCPIGPAARASSACRRPPWPPRPDAIAARSLGGRPGTRKRRGVICSIRMTSRVCTNCCCFSVSGPHALQLRKQGMLDRLPVGGEGDAQVIHFLTTPVDCTLTSKEDVKQPIWPTTKRCIGTRNSTMRSRRNYKRSGSSLAASRPAVLGRLPAAAITTRTPATAPSYWTRKARGKTVGLKSTEDELGFTLDREQP